MSDLARLEAGLPPVFRRLAEMARAHADVLDCAGLLAGVAAWMDLWDARRGELDAEARFRMVWGDQPGIRTGILAWVDRVADVIALDAFAPFADQPGYEAMQLYLVELITRNGGQVPEAQAALLMGVALGELSLAEALAETPPREGAADLPAKSPVRTNKPLAEIFAELEARAAATGVTLAVTPLLAAARQYAATADPALAASELHGIAPNAEVPDMAFSTWYELARSLVEDDVRFEGALPHFNRELRERQLDVMLYMLESTTGPYDLDDDATDANVDALIAGTKTLADALKR